MGRNGDWIASEPEAPGVWRRKAGGYFIRGRIVDPRTGKLTAVCRNLPKEKCQTAREAAKILEDELQQKIGDVDAAPAFPRFDSWAATVFERKVANGDIASAAGRAKWETIAKCHLIPAFGPMFVDRIAHEDVERWKVALLGPRAAAKDDRSVRKLEAGRYSPQTVNTILAVMRQITAEASRAFNIRDAASDIENASTRGHRTYTYEEPNAVKPEDVPRFLDEILATYPKHYAFIFMGFTTGLRPSSLRPLRRRGPSADVKWKEGKLLIRRSHTIGREVMETTKTDRDQVLDLDPKQLEILEWHVARLEHEKAPAAMRESDLLFPAPSTRWGKGGGFRSKSCLGDVFTEVGTKLELGYSVSPRAMRRTFQDLARAAKVEGIVTRAISGHATKTMQDHYSTVGSEEVRRGLAGIIDIAIARRPVEPPPAEEQPAAAAPVIDIATGQRVD